MNLPADWYQVKLFLTHATGFSMDALHVLLGVALHLTFAMVLRSSVAKPMPLLLVVGFELLNEASDFAVERWPQFGMQLGESARDVALTLALPVLLFLVARRAPRLLR